MEHSIRSSKKIKKLKKSRDVTVNSFLKVNVELKRKLEKGLGGEGGGVDVLVQ